MCIDFKQTRDCIPMESSIVYLSARDIMEAAVCNNKDFLNVKYKEQWR